MPRTRYVKSAEEIARIRGVLAAPAFLDTRSLTVTFETDPEVLAEILPPPLLPAAQPRASITVSEIGRSNCVGPFNGCLVNFACSYGGKDGNYCLTMPMSTDLAVIFGRELYAEPKKLAQVSLQQRPGHIRGTVTRYGIPYIEISGAFEGEPREIEPVSRESRQFYFKFFPSADGHGLAGDPQLVCVTHRGITRRVAEGSGTITLRESPHDPVIDVPVLSVTGAVYSEGETHTSAEVLATVPADLFLPWAYGKMDDLLVFATEPELAHT